MTTTTGGRPRRIGDRCTGCGGREFKSATDNNGNEYMGCVHCVIALPAPAIAKGPMTAPTISEHARKLVDALHETTVIAADAWASGADIDARTGADAALVAYMAGLEAVAERATAVCRAQYGFSDAKLDPLNGALDHLAAVRSK